MALFDIFKKKKKDEKKVADTDKKPAEVKEETKEVKSEAAAQKTETVPTSKAKSVKPDTKTESKPAASTKAKSDEKQIAKAAPTPEEKPSAKSNVNSEEKNETAKEFKGYTGRFEINKSKDGKKFFFNLYASNKVGIATSQMYSSAQSALIGIKSVIANAADAPIEDQSLKKYETLPFPKWEIYIDNGGKYRFRLNASNGSCVCHSQGYTTKTACKNGIDSIIRSSRNAEIDKTYLDKKGEN